MFSLICFESAVTKGHRMPLGFCIKCGTYTVDENCMLLPASPSQEFLAVHTELCDNLMIYLRWTERCRHCITFNESWTNENQIMHRAAVHYTVSNQLPLYIMLYNSLLWLLLVESNEVQSLAVTALSYKIFYSLYLMLLAPQLLW